MCGNGMWTSIIWAVVDEREERGARMGWMVEKGGLAVFTVRTVLVPSPSPSPTPSFLSLSLTLLMAKTMDAQRNYLV